MKSLSINGCKLYEVEMLLVPYNKKSVCHLQYPKERIKYERINNNNELTLKIPSMLALELYRKEIIPQDQNTEIALSISGKKIGNYSIADFRYPNNHFDIITIVLKKSKGDL